jgi:hypothetical protein
MASLRGGTRSLAPSRRAFPRDAAGKAGKAGTRDRRKRRAKTTDASAFDAFADAARDERVLNAARLFFARVAGKLDAADRAGAVRGETARESARARRSPERSSPRGVSPGGSKREERRRRKRKRTPEAKK